MSEINPLEALANVADQKIAPDPKFAVDLIDQLIGDLDDVGPDTDDQVTAPFVMESEPPTLAPTDMSIAEPSGGRNRWLVAAAAAALLVVVLGIASVLGGEDNTLITDDPTPSTTVTPTTEAPSTVAPTTGPPPTTAPTTVPTTTTQSPPTTAPILDATVETPAVALLEEALSLAGDQITVATVPESHQWNMVTFDPLDPDRIMFADTLADFMRPGFEGTSPELWNVRDGTGAPSPTLPWYEENGPFPGGVFQTDGSIHVSFDRAYTGVILLDNDGEFVSQRRIAPVRDSFSAQFPSAFASSERGTTAALLHNFSECPFVLTAIFRAGEDEADIVDRTDNGFARMTIVEPGTAVAFPHLPDKESCEPLAATAAQAWDLETAMPLEDHVFTGLEIARGTISRDRQRAVIMSPDGEVSVISTRDRSTISTLADAVASRGVFLPLALNADGTLAGIAEDNGRFTLWHVDTGTLLLELQSDPRPGPVYTGAGLSEPDYPVGAQLSYDLSRVAILDEAAGTWRIVSLDPADWLTAACENGLDVGTAELGNIELPANCP